VKIFIFCFLSGVISVTRKNCLYSSGSLEETSTRFKGQMVYLDNKDLMLFQCSPCIMSVDDLFKHGLYISDIPMHDSNRELMLINEHWSEEFVLTQNLEILTDKLQQATKELESEKQKTDQLLYECLPPSIAQQLRQDKPVVPARYEMISLMFCGIKDFNLYCMKHSNNSQQIVNLLNTVFTVLDQKLHKYPEVYKVETIGDKYMAVCGLPEKIDNNTLYVCRLALDIIEATNEISKLIKEQIVLTIGINSGPVVTGVIGKRMPRYCLFGDTVNLTSRCETTGVKGKINVSEFAYE
jgi:guanylate cyclase soluble subunit beta